MDQHQDELSSASSTSSRSSGLPESLQSSDSAVLERVSSKEDPKDFRRLAQKHLLGPKHDRKPDLSVFKFFSDPFNVSKIIKFMPKMQHLLLKQFITLENCKPGFVWNLMQEYNEVAEYIVHLPDSHLYGFVTNLQIGRLLVKAGWYAEARLILKVALLQATGRVIQQLRVLPVILLAQSFSSLHVEARKTIQNINELIRTTDLPGGLRIFVYSALSTSYFEMGNFETSYREALMALLLLNVQDSTSEVIVATFRLMARSCIALGQMWQAKLLLTQALSWCSAHLGKVSLAFAESLEDYAFYLLMMNSYEGCKAANEQAKHIYQELYGPLGLKPELAQGNLTFRLFLECYEFHSVLPATEYVEIAYELGSNKHPGTEDRQIVAIKRMPALIAAANRCYEENPADNKRRDVLEPIHSQISIEDVRMLFQQFLNE